jgi:predicted ATPase
MFRSEVRDSTINALLEKANERNYGRYLPKLTLKKLRGFSDEPISFDFPVTAIIGPNGGGKTTILGAAACAYKMITPRTFFAKSGKYDDGMQDWSIEYELIDKGLNPKDTIRRTASFKNLKWNRGAIERKVLVFGVSRTVPANERRELLLCASRNFSVPEKNIKHFSDVLGDAVARILSKDVKGFRELRIGQSGNVTLLTGVTGKGIGYSEFHFGAGESSIIRMVATIESAEDQSLVLIEEIENGLHPVATIRLVEYLIWAAERKRIQVIFTTHSNEALQPLPNKAVWVATQDKIFQGKLDVRSLRAITGQIETTAVVFVEDEFAKVWMEAILRQNSDSLIGHVQVHAMAGDGTAVAMNRYHNQNPAIKIPSICFIDGDSQQKENDGDRVYRLYGESPEAFVFDSVLQDWDLIGGRLAVALLQRFDQTEQVKDICRSIRRQNKDPHLLFAQLGEQLGLVPEQTVSAAFATIWAQSHSEVVTGLLAQIRKVLPQDWAAEVTS